MKDIIVITLSIFLVGVSYCEANGNYQVHSDGTITMIGDRFDYQDNSLELIQENNQLIINKCDHNDLNRYYQKEMRHENNYIFSK